MAKSGRRITKTTTAEVRDAVLALFVKCKADKRLRQANEASTRVELIDGVLKALGWPSFDAAREVPSGTGRFLDYELRTSREPWMVVEAKRVEATFELSIPAPKGSGLPTSVVP
jgi:hypothetical protein